jgi:Ice-binding-like/Bacterial Ig-like domain
MTVMPRCYNPTIWFIAFLLLIFSAGCGDPDKTGTNPGTTPPTVLSVTPSDGVCPDTTVTATFSEAMNPATITTTTFTLTGTGGASVAGTVTYDVPSRVATFTQTSPPLLLDTTYTATITTGAVDLFGVPLATDKVWTFTTSATACPAPIAFGPPGCGAGILAGQAITSTGLSTVSGDLDISPLSSITGFPPGTYTGTEHIDDATAAQAQTQLTTAYTTASTLPPGTSLAPDIGNSTLPPGVYTTIDQPSLGITGNLTLDPVGDPNAVWIFQISSTLTTAAGIVTVLPPGKPGNVFWAIGSAATLGTTTTMAGNLMAQAAITMNTGATLNGRALASTAGAVTIDASTINVPPCP